MTRAEAIDTLWAAWWCGAWTPGEWQYLSNLIQEMIAKMPNSVPSATVPETIAFFRRAHDKQYQITGMA